MILVRTYLAESPRDGIGLFAAEFIAKGTVTWKYTRGLDKTYTDTDISRMSPMAREQFLKYAYFDKRLGKYVLCFDDQRFINHNPKDPNILSTPRVDVAARDIEPGEELTCNYNHYDDTLFARLGVDEKSFVVLDDHQQADTPRLDRQATEPAR